MALRRYNRRQKYHKSVQLRFKEARITKLYDVWRKAYLAEQAKVDFFNKTLICIKNNIAMRAYKTLALNALKGRLKKRADVHRYWSMLHKVIESFKKRVNRRKRSIFHFQTLRAYSQKATL